jgi:hypothetical protein
MTTRDRKVSKYTTSRGVPWSEVPIRDVPGMVQDGLDAAALLAAVARESTRTAGDAAEARKVLKAVEQALKCASRFGIEA